MIWIRSTSHWLKKCSCSPSFQERGKTWSFIIGLCPLLLCYVITMEHITYENIVHHLEDNDSLFAKQHGYRKNHSCETRLILTVEDLAISKAVYKVPHQCLINKLHFYGIQEVPLHVLNHGFHLHAPLPHQDLPKSQKLYFTFLYFQSYFSLWGVMTNVAPVSPSVFSLVFTITETSDMPWLANRWHTIEILACVQSSWLSDYRSLCWVVQCLWSFARQLWIPWMSVVSLSE